VSMGVTEDSWHRMQAEIERQIQARLAELRGQGKTLYQVAIDEDDTSPGKPELWCIVQTDTDEVLQRRMSDEEVSRFIEGHPDWVDIWEVDDRIRDSVSETWET